MRRSLCFLKFVFPVLVATTLSAKADDSLFSGFYVTGEAGALFTNGSGSETVLYSNGASNQTANKTLGTAGMVGVGIGKRFTPNFRGDVTFNARLGMNWDPSGSTSGSGLGYYDARIDSYSLMANAYWDIHRFEFNQIALTPYLSGGLGVAFHSTGRLCIYQNPNTVLVKSASNADFAFQVGAGVGVGLSERFDLDLGYRYVDLGRFKTGTDGDLVDLSTPVRGDISGHELKMGLRYSF